MDKWTPKGVLPIGVLTPPWAVPAVVEKVLGDRDCSPHPSRSRDQA